MAPPGDSAPLGNTSSRVLSQSLYTLPTNMAAFTTAHFGDLPSVASSIATNPRSNDVSTVDTVRQMTQLAKHYSHDPIVQAAVEMALTGLPATASSSEVTETIYDWVRSNVRFTEDEETLKSLFGLSGEQADLIITPPRLLTMPVPQGDCDCISTLLASMLLASKANVGVSFVTVAADGSEPDRFSHVYVLASLPCGQQVPLDASHGNYAGWETGNVWRKQLFELQKVEGCNGKGKAMISGLGWELPGWLTEKVIPSGMEILERRYGVPPAGTQVMEKDGQYVVTRQPTYPGLAIGAFPPEIGGAAGSIVTWGLILGAVIVLVKVLKG